MSALAFYADQRERSRKNEEEEEDRFCIYRETEKTDSGKNEEI